MNLFTQTKDNHLRKKSPLAEKMRPNKLDDILGQEEILGKGKLLRRAIETDNLTSVIFYGPPGSGKTTLANVIAETTKGNFEKINAVIANLNDLRKVIKEAEDRISLYQQKTIVFIDEIHRFNKTQQDALLPSVEKGIITLIGATTENPYFSINSALLSRSLIFKINPLSEDNIVTVLKKALNDCENGLGNLKVNITEEALNFLAKQAQGDARIALNALELAVNSTPPDSKGIRNIDLNIIEESIQKPALKYDKDGDQHYDVVSAFIKSMRGSDPDATLHYLARMLEAGEDPRFIARRIVIHAAEDVGLADPQALVIAQNAAQALEYVGLPEGRIILAQAALYIALTVKSNSVIKGIDNALADIKKGNYSEVPLHLRDGHYKGAKELDHGIGYKYPHDYPNHYVQQQYLPKKLAGTKYYQPSDQGFEKKFK